MIPPTKKEINKLLKNTQTAEWHLKTEKWMRYGKRRVKKVSSVFDDVRTFYDYRFWLAGYNQAITDFITRFRKEIK